MSDNQFFDDAYRKIKAAIEEIDPATASEVYALSFWKTNDNDDPRYPEIIVSYNTESQVNDQRENAADEHEARWNYAFWLQDDLLIVGGEDDQDYLSWLQSTPFYDSDESVEAAETNNDTETLAVQDSNAEHIQGLFIENIIAIANRLHQDGVIGAKFNKPIPILLHELEYYDLPIGWTKRANPPSYLTDFLQWYQSMCSE
jgi:hypothetical protein